MGKASKANSPSAPRAITGNLAEHEAEWQRQELVAQLTRNETPQQQTARRHYGASSAAQVVVRYDHAGTAAGPRPARRYHTLPDGAPIIPTPLVEPSQRVGLRLMDLYAARQRAQMLRRRLLGLAILLTLILGGITAALTAIVLSSPKHDGVSAVPASAGSEVDSPLHQRAGRLQWQTQQRRPRAADATVRASLHQPQSDLQPIASGRRTQPKSLTPRPQSPPIEDSETPQATLRPTEF
ncbi:MAG: hypothetical protein KDD75_24405 [Caldilineaceae bacterium]|nr:hypothetical protein [Caldilineaceae bacterium]